MTRHLSDWLESYLQFTQQAESPTSYHTWSGITAIASVLKRKCYANWGLMGYIYPNFYVALVGPPGGRKGTAMKIAKSMLQQLEIKIGSDALGSTQILYKEIKDSEEEFIEFNGKTKKHKSLSIWSEEFQVFLSDKDPMLISSITDLFDCSDQWKYSTLSRGVDDLSNCFLNIIGAITPSLLQSKLSSDAVGGGLVSRIIFIVGYGAIKKRALQFLSDKEKALQKQLIEDLQQISILSGPFKLTNDFLNVFVDWYENTPSTDGVDVDKFMGYNARRALHIKKLCMIFSASESDEMSIESRHFKKALAVLEDVEKDMPNAFYGLGRGAHSEVYTSVLRYIENQDSFSWGDILAKFQLDTLPNELEQYLTMLESTNKIKSEVSPTQTRYVVNQMKKVHKESSYLSKTLFKNMGISLK